MGVIRHSLVVLHPHEVVLASKPEPTLVHLGALAIAHRCVVTHDPVIDDRNAQPHGQIGAGGLDGSLPCAMAGFHAVGHRIHLLGEHDVREAIPLHAGLLRACLQGGPLQFHDEGRQSDPRQQTGEIGLVQRDGIGDAVPESLRDDSAVASEETGSFRVEPGSTGREPVRAGEMVEGHYGSEAELDTSIDDCLIVVKLVGVEDTGFRLDSSPLHGEAIGVQAKTCREGDVLSPARIRIASPVRRLMEDRRRHLLGEPRVAEGVVALDLMAGGRRAPDEAFGEWTGHTYTSHVHSAGAETSTSTSPSTNRHDTSIRPYGDWCHVEAEVSPPPGRGRTSKVR